MSRTVCDELQFCDHPLLCDCSNESNISPVIKVGLSDQLIERCLVSPAVVLRVQQTISIENNAGHNRLIEQPLRTLKYPRYLRKDGKRLA